MGRGQQMIVSGRGQGLLRPLIHEHLQTLVEHTREVSLFAPHTRRLSILHVTPDLHGEVRHAVSLAKGFGNGRSCDKNLKTIK